MIAGGPIAAQLKAAGFKTVEGLIEYAALTAVPANLPALFVVPIDDSAAPNQMAGIIRQRVSARFQVIVVVAAHSRRRDGPAEDLHEATSGVIKALLAWTHPEADAPTEYDGGRLLSADGRAVAWAVRFRAAYNLRAPA